MGAHPYEEVVDAFATHDKRPSVKFPTIGTSYTLVVQSAPKLVQARNYDDGEPAFWPDGKPKMSAVVDVQDAQTGEDMSLWAPKPSALFAAIGEAQRAAGQTIAAGGTLQVAYVADKPNEKNPRLNAAKQYTVTYTPPGPGGAGDPFATPVVEVSVPPSWADAGAPTPHAPSAPEMPTAEQIAAVEAAGMTRQQVWPHLYT